MKKIALGTLGVSVLALGGFATYQTVQSAQKEKQDKQTESPESLFIGDAVSSVGSMVGALIFLVIFLILVGIALAIYAANKTAENASNLTFDEGARRTERVIDISGKAKDVWRR